MNNIFLSAYLLGNVYKSLPIKYKYQDYLSYSSYDELKNNIHKEFNIAIGYSLGGRILLRLLSEKHIKVNKLYLISAPYYTYQTSGFPYGIKENTYRIIEKFMNLLPDFLVNGILKILYYIGLLPNNNWNYNNIKYWFNFLAEPFPLNNINVDCTIIQGTQDALVSLQNSEFLAKELNAELITIEKTGHIITADKVRKFIF